WFGNSFSAKDSEALLTDGQNRAGAHAWVQSGIAGICVRGDGTLIATSIWDEPHKEIGFYKDGACVGPIIKGGGGAIACDERHLYQGTSGMGKPFVGLRRLTLDGKEAPWPERKEWPRFDTPKVWDEVQGLVHDGKVLAMSATGIDKILLFDLATGADKGSFAVEKPGRLAFDRAGMLWIAMPAGVVQYALDGKATGKRIDAISARALTVDRQGRLLVGEDGKRHQVVTYDISGAQPKEVAALGALGGVLAFKGVMADDRLIGPDHIGVDDAGCIYVSDHGLMRSYAPDGALRWQLECTVFCTIADLDPATDGRDLYTGSHHYAAVPGQPPGKDWRWVGWTSDWQRSPEYPSGGGEILMRRLANGKLYRYGFGEPTLVQRQEDDSEIFVPAAAVWGRDFQKVARPAGAPESGRLAWCDRNGDGRTQPEELEPAPKDDRPVQAFYSTWVDRDGGIWDPQDRGGVRYLPLSGFTDGGAPIYDWKQAQWFKRPPEFIQVLRAFYFPGSDTMYLAGNTWDHPEVASTQWGCCGHELIRYDDWMKPTRTLHCRMPFPEAAVDIKAISVSESAGRAFVGESQTSVVFTYDIEDGRLLGIVEPDPALVGTVGWIDIDGGVRSFTRSDGETILLVEDSWAQKQMVYRLPQSPAKR
ncbi:MAG: hypothetical protein H0X45_13760, partial [Planctomycetes bacterium]|nr:hypothetical protein [Planctomycetota bacterium]